MYYSTYLTFPHSSHTGSDISPITALNLRCPCGRIRPADCGTYVEQLSMEQWTDAQGNTGHIWEETGTPTRLSRPGP